MSKELEPGLASALAQDQRFIARRLRLIERMRSAEEAGDRTLARRLKYGNYSLLYGMSPLEFYNAREHEADYRARLAITMTKRSNGS